MKKILALVLALMLALTAAVACAELTPSMSATALIAVTGLEAINGAELTDDFVVTAATLTVETNPAAAAAYAEILDTVVTNEQPAITAFNEDTQALIAETLPMEFDVNTLTVSEVAPLVVENYNPEFGDVVVNMAFATLYDPEQTVVTVLGCKLPKTEEQIAAEEAMTEEEKAELKAMDEFTWVALENAVNEDGTLAVTVTADAFNMIAEGEENMIVVMNDVLPVEEETAAQ